MGMMRDERAEWICGILVLGGAAPPQQGTVGVSNVERHESREVRECAGVSVTRGCGYPIGTRVPYPVALAGRGVKPVTGGCCTRATAQRAPPRLQNQISINRPIVEPLSPAPAQDGKMLRGSRKRLVADKLA
jgi:hypothetical protein